MSRTSNVTYLNLPSSMHFYSPLRKAIADGQKRAPAKQWPNIIKSLRNKGVKEAEINDSKILELIEAKGDGPVTREEVIALLDENNPFIKEIAPSKKKFQRYSHARHGSNYQERLFTLASHKEFLEDLLLDIDFELDDLDFYPERLIANPLLAQELYKKKVETQNKINAENINSRTSLAHYSDIVDPDTGKPIKNLLFHTRTSLQDNGTTFFVEEVQSDWAQRGRRNDWVAVEKGPFVTNTDLWTSLAFKRLMQLAAQNPKIKRFMWITGDYRNGGRFITNDGLNDFYIKVVGKNVNRVLSGTGTKCDFQKIKLGEEDAELPGFEMTDAVRKKLLAPLPLYSRDAMRGELELKAQQRLAEQMKPMVNQAQLMLGDSASIKLLGAMMDADNNPVAGQFFGHCIDVSLSGSNPVRALSHECWHYAYEHLLTGDERRVADSAFNDQGLLTRLQEAMKNGGFTQDAIDQCSDPMEAVAHAYSLWVSGEFTLGSQDPDLLNSAFTRTKKAFTNLHEQIDATFTTEAETELLGLFNALSDGYLCQRQEATPVYYESMGMMY